MHSRPEAGLLSGFDDPLEIGSASLTPPAGVVEGLSERVIFHAELRQRTLPILFWSACVFNVVYVAWTGFDYALAPELWERFLVLRLCGALLNTLIVVGVHQPRFRKYTWEAFWLWFVVMGCFICPMLAMVEASSYTHYVMGFTLVLYGVGLLPYWHPTWAISCASALLLLLPLAFAFAGEQPSARDLISAGFFSISGAGISMLMALFKYTAAKRDFVARTALSELARREHRAHVELARTSSALGGALEQLKELDRLKSQFFANISHELRTPLTLILGPLERMSHELESEQQQKTLMAVGRNAQRLLRLIDDLLELSRLDAGGLRLNVAQIDVRIVAATVHENALPAAASRNIAFTLQASSLSQKVWGDAHRLEIVLTNLIGNALKFTPEGGRVELSVVETKGGVRLDVSDTGPGITEEDLPRIFERFYQVLRTDRRKHPGGAGIGLALAKELVELHGGTLQVRSKVGEGTTFSALLPFGDGHIREEVIERRREFRPGASFGRRGEDAPEPFATEVPKEHSEQPKLQPERRAPRREPASPKPLLMRGRRRARIVVAEDQEELRDFISELLSPDYDVFSAPDGDEAWDVVVRERPDLVISDVMMPGRSGTSLCLDVKSDAALRATPVILLTARAGSEATLEGYAHGADDFVAKPFHPRVLLARVRAQLLLRSMALELAETEKLAAVGTLAAGILHEVRNPVNAILNAARVLAEGEVEVSLATRLLGIVGDSAQRIHEITRVLDVHAKPSDAGGTVLFDVREGIEATLTLLSHRLRSVKLESEYCEARFVRAKAGPLNQVFVNLIDNALNAGAKSLRISTREQERRVEVCLEDDGPGVPAELRDRIFEPFVTGSNSGTGLGLYLSRCIVEDQGGSLWVEPGRQGRGAAFFVALPKESA